MVKSTLYHVHTSGEIAKLETIISFYLRKKCLVKLKLATFCGLLASFPNIGKKAATVKFASKSIVSSFGESHLPYFSKSANPDHANLI